MAPISGFGRKLLLLYSALMLLSMVVVALSARVNIFQEYFYLADLFPLALSITTLVLSVFLVAVSASFRVASSFLARPKAHIAVLSLLSVLWLASNAFSSSRWVGIPFPCSDIPSEYDDVRVWCQDAQALKFFVWILFLVLLFTISSVIRYVVLQARHGNRHIWKSSLSRFDPRASIDFGHNRAPSVFQTGATGPVDHFAGGAGGYNAFAPGTKW